LSIPALRAARPNSRAPLVVLVVVSLLATAACTRVIRSAPAHDWSGFLDDYSRLELGGPGDLPFVYRNPKARWSAYDAVLFEPVTLWRSGRDSLAAIAEQDLLRLVARFEAFVRGRLGKGFRLVSDPEPGTLRVRLAITEARAADPVVDVLTASPEEDDPAGGTGPLPRALAAFVDAAVVEGEIRDAVTDDLLAQGIDRRAEGAPPRVRTWEELDRALAFWADRTCGRLEARTGR
jgi:hypothetical protein